jgi:hypothetical protein
VCHTARPRKSPTRHSSTTVRCPLSVAPKSIADPHQPRCSAPPSRPRVPCAPRARSRPRRRAAPRTTTRSTTRTSVGIPNTTIGGTEEGWRTETRKGAPARAGDGRWELPASRRKGARDGEQGCATARWCARADCEVGAERCASRGGGLGSTGADARALLCIPLRRVRWAFRPALRAVPSTVRTPVRRRSARPSYPGTDSPTLFAHQSRACFGLRARMGSALNGEERVGQCGRCRAPSAAPPPDLPSSLLPSSPSACPSLLSYRC